MPEKKEPEKKDETAITPEDSDKAGITGPEPPYMPKDPYGEVGSEKPADAPPADPEKAEARGERLVVPAEMAQRINVQGARVVSTLEPGFVEIPQISGGSNGIDAGAGRASVSYPALTSPAGWGMLYLERRTTAADFMRTINPSSSAFVLALPGGRPYPPGYRVPNGQVGGGFASGNVPATPGPNDLIRIQMPPIGVGRLQCVSFFKFTVHNGTSNQRGAYRWTIGVAHVNGPDRPQWPYLGIAHDYEARDMRPITIGPGETQVTNLSRMDIVDNERDGPIPGWPNWRMREHPASRLYPALCIHMIVDGPAPLRIGQVFAFCYVT